MSVIDDLLGLPATANPPYSGGTPPGGGGTPGGGGGGGGTPPGGYVGPPRLNTAPTAATDTNAATNGVVEGAAVNTLVGITAHSTDAEQGVTYALASDNSGGGFKIDPTTGVVTVADPSKINFETAPGHAYTITVNSSDGITVTAQSFTINVSDVAPSTPVDSNAAANTVAEGAAANTLVGITASASRRRHRDDQQNPRA
jgi:hypothetical protein